MTGFCTLAAMFYMTSLATKGLKEAVLNSKKAIAVNIQIMRIITRVQQMLADTLNLQLEIEEIRQKIQNQDKNIELVFSYLDELITRQEGQSPR